MLALARGGVTPPAAAVSRLESLQCSDGGFSSVLLGPTDPCNSDVDTTGYVLQALSLLSGTGSIVANGRGYLLAAQQADGGFIGTAGENANSTGLAGQGLLVSGTGTQPQVTAATTFLLGLQDSDGGFAINASTPGSDVRSTTQALPAIAGTILTTVSDAVTLPTSTPTPTPTVTATTSHTTRPTPTATTRPRQPSVAAVNGSQQLPTGTGELAATGIAHLPAADRRPVADPRRSGRPAAGSPPSTGPAPVMLRRLLPIAVLLFCCGIIGTGSAAATALPIQDCTSTSGVIVVVDFGHWGGPLVRSCGSTPTSGYQLVNQGGLATTPVSRFPGFVCRIGYSGFNGGTRYPTDQACVNTPPANDSWSYWNANPTDPSWAYSPKGASENHPTGGAVQAWTFGGGSPAFSPASVRAHNASAPVGGSKSSGGEHDRHAGAGRSPAARPELGRRNRARRSANSAGRTTSGAAVGGRCRRPAGPPSAPAPRSHPVARSDRTAWPAR